MRAFSLSPAIVCTLLVCAVSCGTKDPVVNRTVKTISATEITSTAVLLTGQTGPFDSSSGIVVGFIISEKPNPAPGNGKEIIAESISEDGSFTARVSNLLEETKYYYVAFERSLAYRYGETLTFSTAPFQIEAIDLGLSVKWANANIGATGAKDPGEYYAWGEIETKDVFTLDNYKFNDPSKRYGQGWYTKYNSSELIGIIDNKDQLDPEDDVAHVKLGGKWRMPTAAEWEELINNCTWGFTWSYDDQYNTTITSTVKGPNGNMIFLPHTVNQYEGYYWSSTLSSNSFAITADITSSSTGSRMSISSREYGLVVRAVCDK